MLEPMAQRVVHWSQPGFVKGRQMSANVVQGEAAVEEHLNDEDAEPASSGSTCGVFCADWAFRWGWSAPLFVCMGRLSFFRRTR